MKQEIDNLQLIKQKLGEILVLLQEIQGTKHKPENPPEKWEGIPRHDKDEDNCLTCGS